MLLFRPNRPEVFLGRRPSEELTAGWRRRPGLVLTLASVAAAVSACATKPPTLPAERAAICSDQRFPIYFAPGSDQLTEPGRRLISDTAAHLKSCRLGTVQVLGLSDATGTGAQGVELSQRRAATVTAALKAAGLPAPSFETAAAGAQGSTTAGGRRVPVHRLAEVIIHATPQ